MENWGLGKWLAAGVASLMVLFGLIVVGHGIAYGEWQLNWWYKVQNTNRQTQLTYKGVANQSALRDEISRGITQIYTDTTNIVSANTQGLKAYANSLKPPRYALANEVCGWISQLSNPGSLSVDTGWAKANCANGVDRPGTQYYYNQGG